MAKKKFILKSVGICKSCNIEVINTDSFVIFADRTCQHTTCYEQSETTRQNSIKERPVANQDSEKRMQMYIEYLKTKKCKHKYQTE